MKKILFLLAVVILLLAACGEDHPKEKESAEKEEPKIESNETNQLETLDDEIEESEKENEEDADDHEDVEQVEQSELIEDENEVEEDGITHSLTEIQLHEIISDYGVGEEDDLVSTSFKDRGIKAVIQLELNDLFEPELLATTRYSQISDELLEYEGWDVLTIEYVGIGTVRMNRIDKETNEFGMDYFPIAEIEQRLK